jgi:hypothetical protein
MDWQVVQAVAELVAAGGVILSLVYLSIQVRQNTQSIRTAANQDLMTAFNDVAAIAGHGRHGARLYHALIRGTWEELDPYEEDAASMLLIQNVRVFEQAFLQHRAGFLDDDVWEGWERQMKLSQGLPGVADGWPAVRQFVNADFAMLLDGFAEEEPHAIARERTGSGQRGDVIQRVEVIEDDSAT